MGCVSATSIDNVDETIESWTQVPRSANEHHGSHCTLVTSAINFCFARHARGCAVRMQSRNGLSLYRDCTLKLGMIFPHTNYYNLVRAIFFWWFVGSLLRNYCITGTCVVTTINKIRFKWIERHPKSKKNRLRLLLPVPYPLCLAAFKPSQGVSIYISHENRT